MRKITVILLHVYVFTVPWDFVEIPGVGALTRLAGLGVFAAAILCVASEGRFRKPDWILGLATAFTVFNLLTLLWTVSYADTLQAVVTYVQLLGSLWIVREFTRGPEDRQRLLATFCMGTFIPLLNLLDNFRTGLGANGRFTAEGFTADGLGLMLALVIPIAWHLFTTRGRALRTLMVLLLLLAPTAILLTASRTGFVVTIVAASIVPMTLLHRRRIRPLSAFALLVLIPVGLLAFVPQSSWTRIASIPEEIVGGSMSERRNIWSAGMRAFPEHPIGGAGAGTFSQRVVSLGDNIIDPTTPAHNVILGILVEHGVVGLTLYLALLGACAAAVYRMPPPDRTLWAIVLATWFIGTMSLSVERWKVTWLLFGLLASYGHLRGWRNAAPAVSRANSRPGLTSPSLRPVAPQQALGSGSRPG